MLGFSVLLPASRRAFCQRRFAAKTARMMASEDPTVETPSASSSSEWRGALKRRATMLTLSQSVQVSFRGRAVATQHSPAGLDLTTGRVLFEVDEVLAQVLNHELLRLILHVPAIARSLSGLNRGAREVDTHVVTNEARLSAGLPSIRSSSCSCRDNQRVDRECFLARGSRSARRSARASPRRRAQSAGSRRWRVRSRKR